MSYFCECHVVQLVWSAHTRVSSEKTEVINVGNKNARWNYWNKLCLKIIDLTFMFHVRFSLVMWNNILERVCCSTKSLEFLFNLIQLYFWIDESYNFGARNGFIHIKQYFNLIVVNFDGIFDWRWDCRNFELKMCQNYACCAEKWIHRLNDTNNSMKLVHVMTCSQTHRFSYKKSNPSVVINGCFPFRRSRIVRFQWQ